MKCSKVRPTFRPLVENLESRLQPGSIITGQGYGWSLLADRISILNQPSLDSQGMVAPSSSESSRSNPISTSANVLVDISSDVHSENLTTAVASVAAASSSGLPANSPVNSLAINLVNNLASNLTNDNLASLPLASQCAAGGIRRCRRGIPDPDFASSSRNSHGQRGPVPARCCQRSSTC